MFLSTMTVCAFLAYIVVKKNFGFSVIMHKKFPFFYKNAFVCFVVSMLLFYGNFTLAIWMINWYNKNRTNKRGFSWNCPI